MTSEHLRCRVQRAPSRQSDASLDSVVVLRDFDMRPVAVSRPMETVAAMDLCRRAIRSNRYLAAVDEASDPRIQALARRLDRTECWESINRGPRHAA